MGQWRAKDDSGGLGDKYSWIADWDEDGKMGMIVRGGEGETAGSTNQGYAIGYCRYPEKEFYYLCERLERSDEGVDLKTKNFGYLKIKPKPPLEVWQM